MKKKNCQIIAGIFAAAIMAAVPCGSFALNTDISASAATDTKTAKDYITSMSVKKVTEFADYVTDVEMTTNTNGVNIYKWYISADLNGKTYDKALIARVEDDGTSYKIYVNLSNDFYLNFKKQTNEATNMIFSLQKELEIKFNEACFADTLDYHTKIYNKTNNLSFTKKYDSVENVVDYSNNQPELYVTYTSDKTIGIRALGSMSSVGVVNTDVLADFEIKYAKSENTDLSKADTSVEILGQRFEKKFRSDINSNVEKKTTETVYTKNFETSVGNCIFTMDNTQKCKVMQIIKQNKLEDIYNSKKAGNYTYGNYYQYIVFGHSSETEDVLSDIYHAGDSTQLCATIKKEKGGAMPVKDTDKLSTASVAYYYDEYYDGINTPEIGAIFDFELNAKPYYHSGIISDASFTLANCNTFRQNEIYIAEGFRNMEKQNETGSIGNDVLKKLFPEKNGKGDINEDDTVNIADAILLQNYILSGEISEKTVFNNYNADMVEDDTLNVFDMINLKKKISSK